jgi:hypothetical protein
MSEKKIKRGDYAIYKNDEPVKKISLSGKIRIDGLTNRLNNINSDANWSIQEKKGTINKSVLSSDERQALI